MNRRIKKDLEEWLSGKEIDFGKIIHTTKFNKAFKETMNLLEKLDLNVSIKSVTSNDCCNKMRDELSIKCSKRDCSFLTFEKVDWEEVSKKVDEIALPIDFLEFSKRLLEEGEMFRVELDDSPSWGNVKMELIDQFKESNLIFTLDTHTLSHIYIKDKGVKDVKAICEVKLSYLRSLLLEKESNPKEGYKKKEEEYIIVDGEKYYMKNDEVSISIPFQFDVYTSKSGLRILKAKGDAK